MRLGRSFKRITPVCPVRHGDGLARLRHLMYPFSPQDGPLVLAVETSTVSSCRVCSRPRGAVKLTRVTSQKHQASNEMDPCSSD